MAQDVSNVHINNVFRCTVFSCLSPGCATL